MLKKSASIVLASLRGSAVLEDVIRSPRSILRANGHTKCGWYLLASSLAAALLDGLSKQPASPAAFVSHRGRDVISGVIS
jgi:hypothetical protein